MITLTVAILCSIRYSVKVEDESHLVTNYTINQDNRSKFISNVYTCTHSLSFSDFLDCMSTTNKTNVLETVLYIGDFHFKEGGSSATIVLSCITLLIRILCRVSGNHQSSICLEVIVN